MIKESNFYDDRAAPFRPIIRYQNKNVIPKQNIIEDYNPMTQNSLTNIVPRSLVGTGDRRTEGKGTGKGKEIAIAKGIEAKVKEIAKERGKEKEIEIGEGKGIQKEIVIGKIKHNSMQEESKNSKSIWKVYSEKMIIIHDQYVLSKILGKGSFGIVHQGFHKDTYDPVAIKLEDLSAKTRILSKEYQTYIQVYEPDVGLPRVLAFGEKDEYQYMVMQMLGSSLEEYLRLHQVFSLKTVLMLADQLIERMRFLHRKGFIHRDIKPENFLMGLQENQDIVHIIDLGLAKRWRLPNGGHIKYMTGNKIIGTARYASINSHIGNQLSRRDDMESLGYLLVYLAKGRLPWQSLRSQTKEQKYQQIIQKKQEISVERLCSGLPKEFILYFKHVKSLAFEEEPCYDLLKGLFLTAFSEQKYIFDFRWDWKCN